MRASLLTSVSCFALLSLGGCEFFSLDNGSYVQNCPPGTVIGHCEDSDASIQVEHPKAPPRPDPADDDDDTGDDDDDGGCKDPKGDDDSEEPY